MCAPLHMYNAYVRQGSLISVFAESEMDAKRQIYNQLDRPGRRTLLKAWVREGAKVQERFKK